MKRYGKYSTQHTGHINFNDTTNLLLVEGSLVIVCAC